MIAARMRCAWPATCLVHAIGSVCAWSWALPWAGQVPSGTQPEPAAVGALTTALSLSDAFFRAPLRLAAAPLAFTWLLTPFLRVLWLRAHLLSAPLQEHAQLAARRYPRALAVCAVSIAMQAAACALVGVTGAALAREFASAQGAGWQFVASAVALPFALGALVYGAAFGDAAHAQLARVGASLRAAFRGAWNDVGLRAWTMHAACALTVLALVLVPWWPRVWLGSSAGASWLLAGVGQLSALAQTCLRSYWFAWLVERQESIATRTR